MLLILFIGGLGLGSVAAGAALALLATRTGRRWPAVAVHLVLLSGAVGPFALHARAAFRYAAGFGATGPETPVGVYPELRLFALLGAGLIAVAWLIGALLAWRAPRFTWVVPAGLYVLYFHALPVTARGVGEAVVLDPAPTLWLFVYAACGTLGLAVYGWIVRGRARLAALRDRAGASRAYR